MYHITQVFSVTMPGWICPSLITIYNTESKYKTGGTNIHKLAQLLPLREQDILCALWFTSAPASFARHIWHLDKLMRFYDS